jgi:hypothetical protein
MKARQAAFVWLVMLLPCHAPCSLLPAWSNPGQGHWNFLKYRIGHSQEK